MQAITPCGWLRTGDLGRLDGCGRLWLLGRKKDMIKSGGENVHASEVERVLALHPAVADVAVVGLPNERLGEMVRGSVD
jgi:acyl-activating enzyme 14